MRARSAVTPQSGEGACGADAVLEELAWYCFNSGASTHPVGQKRPNAWGLFDVHGNAAEWTTGLASEAVREATATDPEGVLDEQPIRAARGGWAIAHSSDCRLADWTIGYRTLERPRSD